MQYFTLAEIKRRLRATKQHFERYRNQRVRFLCSHSLPVLQIDSYNALDEMMFLYASQIDRCDVESVVVANRDLFLDESSYKFMSLDEYVSCYRVELQRLFCVTCLRLCDIKGNVLFRVVVCLGSLHHAPRIFYRNEKTQRVYFEKLVEYDDLR